MLPADYALTLQRGDDFDVQFVLKSGADPLDLTGSRITFELVSGPVRLFLDSDEGELDLDAPAGIVSLHLSASQTIALPPPSARQTALYELRRLIDGSEQTFLNGTVTIKDLIE